MEFILTTLTVIFVALVLATAVTFGFALLAWFFAIGIVMAAFFILRDYWRRWRFVRNARPDTRPQIIEVDYKDITDKKGDLP